MRDGAATRIGSAPRSSGRAGRSGTARRSCSRAPTSTRSAAGAVALMVPPDACGRRSTRTTSLDGLDGLILAGGADIDPAAYGVARRTRRRSTRARPRRGRDRAGAAALERDLPVCGICRGMQLMNVARGGRWSSTCPTTSATRTTAAPSAPSTTPTMTCGSARVAGAARAAERWCTHEVASPPGGRRLGEGVVAAARACSTSWSRRSSARRRWALGVQWHPEVDRALARRRRSRRRPSARRAPASRVTATRHGRLPVPEPSATAGGILRARPCPARPPSARPPARCSPPASRRRCSAAGSA